MYGQLLGGDVKRRVSAARLDRFVPVPEAMQSGNRLDLFGAVNEGPGQAFAALTGKVGGDAQLHARDAQLHARVVQWRTIAELESIASCADGPRARQCSAGESQNASRRSGSFARVSVGFGYFARWIVTKRSNPRFPVAAS
jgi:hypothetical protein